MSKSDVYDNWVNPWVAGNGSGIWSNGEPMHGFAASASIIIPANAVVVFPERLIRCSICPLISRTES
jgi:hypothetical protein